MSSRRCVIATSWRSPNEAPAPIIESTAPPGSLPAFHHYRPRAGHPDWPTLLQEAQALAEQVRPNLTGPPSSWADRRRRFASYRTAAQNFATNLELARNGREDLRPLNSFGATCRAC
jgi:hypothetical protein